MEETSFPRGRLVPDDDGVVKKDDMEKKRRRGGTGKQGESKKSDFLFGSAEQDAANRERMTKRTRKSSADLTATALPSSVVSGKSMLPLGGGGCVVPAKSAPYIEPLSFTKLAAGLKLLAVCRQVHDGGLAVFSLPNFWTAYMHTNSNNNYQVEVGQVCSVVVVKAVQESTKDGPRRRIQVACDPAKLNPVDLNAVGVKVTGAIVSIEDHGLLVDLGLKRRGFLPFDEIGGEYTLEEEVEEEDHGKRKLAVGRIMDFVVRGKTEASIVPLKLPKSMAKIMLPSDYKPLLSELQPGTLVQCTVEQTLRNGLAVSFGLFRGAIELQHTGTHWIPVSKLENTDWKKFFDEHCSLTARIIAVDPATKLIRLSLLPHILALQAPVILPETGSLVEDCPVIRLDPGVGALLALPQSGDTEEEGVKPDGEKPLFKPLSEGTSYLNACRVKAVYVHISKSMDDENNGKVPDATFAKQFSPSTKHTVRIINTGNLVDGIASGATAPSILKAHVLTHSDIVPGKAYKQVPVCSLLENGGVLVDFGMGIRGLIPAVQLFDKNATSEYRKKMIKVKYSVGAKVDVRVLSVDTVAKKCTLTAKKSLVKAEQDQIITSYDDIKIGQKAIGYVSNVVDDGLFVTFFNGVFGRVTARSLAAELGVENHREDYARGDVFECRVSNVKKRTKRHSTRWQQDEDEMDADDAEEDDTKYYHELTLSARTNTADEEGTSIADTPLEDHPQVKVQLRAGSTLPLKSLRVIELVPGKQKEKGFIPGYAIVSIKSKYMVGEAEAATMPPHIECKLPYDQLLDRYNEENIESAAALDELAEGLLTVGKKINRRGLVLADPKKSNSEYSSGTGQFAVVSIRPRLIETAVAQLEAGRELSEEEIRLPGPSTHFFTGALVQGYVAQIHPRHGAFVRFLDGLTGLVPKSQGGFILKLYSTVVVKVASVDDKVHPPRIALGLTKVRDSSTQNQDDEDEEMGPQPLKKGDVIKEAEIAKRDFHRVTLKILDDQWSGDKRIRARLHCTMAESQPWPKEGKLAAVNSEQKITSCHPFYKWSEGVKLTNLEVVSVETVGKSWIVEVTSRKDGGVLVDRALSPGDRVSGIVTAVAKNQGLRIQLNPSVSAYAPGLELSEDVNVLNNLARYFPVGSRLQCTVMDKSAWEKTRLKYLKIRPHAKTEQKVEIPFVSVLCTGKMDALAKPPRGALIVGRVDRALSATSVPDLVLDLRGGFVGRCCVTELEEPDERTNFPLGRSHDEAGADKMDIDENEKKDENANDIDMSDENEEKPFSDGMFVQCRVLGDARSKPSMVEVSLRSSRLEGDLDDDEDPEEGDMVQAYVVDTNKSGCYLRLSRRIEGRAMLKELCDGFLPNPLASFPPGRLVVGKVKAIHPSTSKAGGFKMAADIDMRESRLIDDAEDRIKFEDIEIGQKCKGNVTRIEDYGVFVQIQNSEVSGLVHKSQCSDKYIKSLTDLYDPGDLVKLLVLKKDAEKKQLGFSMKASHFEGDDDSDENSSASDDESINDQVDRAIEKEQLDGLDSEDENFAAKLASKMAEADSEQSESAQNSNDDSDDGSGSDSDGSGDSGDDEDAEKAQKLDTNVGFDWKGVLGPSKQTNEVSDDSSDSSDDEDDDDDKQKSSHKSRKKQLQKRNEEQEISRRETALADGTADENPETPADFERLLAGEPNSSEIWIRYMAFHLSLANVPAAREVANRAFERIEFRQEKEKLNVWCALLTLELKYGNEEGLQQTLDRACQHNSPKQVYLRMCEMLEKQATSPDSVKRADEMFVKLCKKFKSKKKAWIAHMEYMLKNGRHEEAYALSKRALLSLKHYKHLETMSKFAQLVFEYGNAEKARTIFEGLLAKYPKRFDLFFVYADKEVKHGEIDVARSLFGRVANPDDETLQLKLTDKQMKLFFKKWFSFEESCGTAETQERVKDAARAFVERTTS